VEIVWMGDEVGIVAVAILGDVGSRWNQCEGC